ncbi:hypothetical protein [Haematobacter genomosp. 1]|uniref:Uncharacterized protein n=1 Tax=Haematobacter genomosp. 1 TaxID=366618 RepID=A0A212AA41_9RHOB|nr:hypothetical protein [Haematobacter genomosp. 1]OWJ76979.1 hypothetical protein CDV49_12540 [Haematobacter genomosp. 1]
MKDTTKQPGPQVLKACDEVVETAARAMVGLGASPEMAIDRMLTYCGASVASWHGSSEAADLFRRLADNIEAGIFAHLDRTAKHVRQ